LCGVVPNNGRAQFEWFVSDYDGDVESSNRLGRWSWGHLTQGAQSLQWGWRAPAVRVPAGQWLGFGYGSSRPWDFVIDNRAYTDEDGARFVIIPYWFLAGTFSILPILALLKARRGPRYAAGHCQVCGYDLRATPERCPECGTVPL
jgi:hypothetical protein